MNPRTALFEICRWVAALLAVVCLLTMFGTNRISDADPAAVEAAVRVRLEPLLAAGADRIVLGCTHFPHLKAVMEKVAEGRAVIVDPSDAVARRIRDVLEKTRGRRVER